MTQQRAEHRPYHLREMDPHDMVQTDLRQEVAAILLQQGNLDGIEAYHVIIDDKAEWAELLYNGNVHRGGVAWGAPADWTTADSAEEVIQRYFGIDGQGMEE